MKKALVIHGNIYEFGGAEATAVKNVKILEELNFEVTVLHAGGALDVERVRQRMGITLDPQRVRFVQAPLFARFPSLLRGRLLLEYAIVVRAAKSLAPKADLVVGTYGETPVEARRLLQSIHIPIFFFDGESLRYLAGRKLGPLQHATRAAYVIASRLIAGWSRRAAERGVMLVNSNWTARQYLRHYPTARVKTLYHGATTEIDSRDPRYLPHAERAQGIVILGRVVPFKRIEAGVAIVDRLREIGHDVALTIVGGGDGDYADKVRALIADRPHATWRRDMPRAELERFISTQRWGLHCAQFEHYGLAPLELERLGCVTFVHDSGGQVEIVQDETQRYQDIDDAVRKMDRVMRDPALAQRLFEALPAAVGRHLTSAYREAFIAEVKATGVLDA